MAQRRRRSLLSKLVFIILTVCILLPFRLAVDSIIIGGIILAAIIAAEINELFLN